MGTDLDQAYIGMWEGLMENGYGTRRAGNGHMELIAPDGEVIGTYRDVGDTGMRSRLLAEGALAHMGKPAKERGVC